MRIAKKKPGKPKAFRSTNGLVRCPSCGLIQRKAQFCREWGKATLVCECRHHFTVKEFVTTISPPLIPNETQTRFFK